MPWLTVSGDLETKKGGRFRSLAASPVALVVVLAVCKLSN